MLNRRQFLRRAAGFGAGAAAIAVVGLPEVKKAANTSSGDLTTTHHFVGTAHDGEYDFDVIVSSCWADEVAAGRGFEGQTFTTLTDSSFRVYSDPNAAIQASNVDASIFIAPGRYKGPIYAKGNQNIMMVGSYIDA